MSPANFKNEIEAMLDLSDIKYNEPMKNHTSFKVGGPCYILLTPESYDDAVKILKLCKKYNEKYFVMGNGTNLIVKDGGFDGVIIKLTKIKNIEVDGKNIIADSGALLSCVSKEALKHNLKGMEFASGIPGTVGGAVAMNAGAYGPEIKDIIVSADVSDSDGNIFTMNKDELDLSYRMSAVQKRNCTVLRATFQLEEGIFETIKNRMNELNKRRADKQPLEYPSAGSTFKRPDGYFAAKLIEDAGLKGLSVGGAAVSTKHSGFIINYNNATASDILNLISEVEKRINEKYGVQLEPEVKIIGRE